jgi:hypothetical protein
MRRHDAEENDVENANQKRCPPWNDPDGYSDENSPSSRGIFCSTEWRWRIENLDRRIAEIKSWCERTGRMFTPEEIEESNKLRAGLLAALDRQITDLAIDRTRAEIRDLHRDLIDACRDLEEVAG